jgi:hypothetical protein
MPKFDWTTETFWSQKAPLIKAAARRWRFHDYREAVGSIWQALASRFPGGLVEGTNPTAYLDKTISAEADKFFRKEDRCRRQVAGRSLEPIDLGRDQFHGSSSPVDELIVQEVPLVVGVLLRGLTGHELELIEARYGFRGDAASTTEIAEVRHVSRQAVLKSIRGIEDHLRRHARLLYLSI